MKSQSISDALAPVVQDVRSAPPTVRRPSDRVWTPEDLWSLTPPEFVGAELASPIKEILNRIPLSVAIIGSPGTGKTRTLWAMAHSLLRGKFLGRLGDPIASSRHMTEHEVEQSCQRQLEGACGMRIITEVGDIRMHRYDRDALADWVNTPGWLAVDDVGCIEPHEWAREALYHLANERRAYGLPTVWTSNLTRQQLRDAFGGAISSRILGGELIELAGPDRRML